jgi:hypothetical protein
MLEMRTKKQLSRLLQPFSYTLKEETILGQELRNRRFHIRIGPFLSYSANAEAAPFKQPKMTQPLVLLASLRTVACIFAASMIGCLEFTLRLSQTNNGLGNLGDDIYLHCLWTSLPAIAFSLPALLTLTFE